MPLNIILTYPFHLISGGVNRCQVLLPMPSMCVRVGRRHTCDLIKGVFTLLQGAWITGGVRPWRCQGGEVHLVMEVAETGNTLEGASMCANIVDRRPLLHVVLNHQLDCFSAMAFPCHKLSFCFVKAHREQRGMN